PPRGAEVPDLPPPHRCPTRRPHPVRRRHPFHPRVDEGRPGQRLRPDPRSAVMSMGYLPLDQIHAHENNPRRHVVADDEMVDSIRAVGVLTPVTVAPALDGDGYTMIGGHRRESGARAAGLTQIPAIIREDLVTEA